MGVVVIGGGVSGCAAAYTLGKLGHEVTLLEAEEGLGGRASTLRDRGFSIDTGAGFLCNFYRRTLALLDELGRTRSLAEMPRVAGLYDGDRVHVVRAGSPLDYLRLPLLGVGDKARIAIAFARSAFGRAVDPFDLDGLARADRGETIADWARRTMGERAYQVLIRPSVEPYWYFRCEDAAAPLVVSLMRVAPRARFMCLSEGMGALCEWMAEHVDVRAGTRVSSVWLRGEGARVTIDGGEAIDAEAVVLATDALEAARLLEPGALSERLAEVPYAANTHVALVYEADLWSEVPAGFVFPVGPGDHDVAGVVLLSRKLSSLVPPGAEVVQVAFSDQASRRFGRAGAETRALEAASRFLGRPAPDPLEAHIFDRARAIPIPRPGAYAALREVREAMPPRLRLAGDYLSHATIEGALQSGEHAARDVHAALA
jgi:protoporphyrinogen/coproporphyrinogen III oxidase